MIIITLPLVRFLFVMKDREIMRFYHISPNFLVSISEATVKSIFTVSFTDGRNRAQCLKMVVAVIVIVCAVK